MKSLIYIILRLFVKSLPPLGEFLLRLKPGNDHFKRYAQFSRAQRIDERNILFSHNDIYSEGTESIDITVIISSFNYAEYIGEAIDSVLKQECDNLELIVVEDNSSDNSGEVIQKRIAGADIPCTVLNLDTNGGLSNARNLGVQYAKGDYIFVLDADNIIKPDGLSFLFQVAQKNHATAAFGKLQVVDHQLKDLGQYKSARMPSFHEFKHKNQLDAMALYKAEYLRETNGFDVEMLLHGWGNEDWEMWTKIFRDSKTSVKFIDEVIGLYRAKPGSMVADAIRSHSNNAAYIQRKYF